MVTLIQFAGGAKIPQSLTANAAKTVKIVNEIFAAFPGKFKFNSGYRAPAHNAKVGGVSNSYHTQAAAADISPLDGNFPKYKAGVIAVLDKYGYELIDESRKPGAAHFHIEPAPNKKKR